MPSGGTFSSGVLDSTVPILKVLVKSLLKNIKTPIAFFWTWILVLRYRAKLQNSDASFSSFENQGIGMNRCELRWINLAHRTDRRDEMLAQLREFGFENAKRIEAVSRSLGILGCAESHLLATQTVLHGSELLMICEDDAMFIRNRREFDKVIESFYLNPGIDVLCMGFNLGARPYRISRELSLTSDTQTASCYVLKPRALDDVRSNLAKSVSKLAAGKPAKKFANDIYWKKLQRARLVFAVPNRQMVIQRPSFSDIEGREVDYGL